MPELDDRLASLRAAVQEAVTDDFADVLDRRRRVLRRNRRVGLASAAAVLVAVFGGVGLANLGDEDRVVVPIGPTPTPSASSSLAPPAGPSQSPADASRDHVVPAVARLPFAARVGVIASVRTNQGLWVVSRMPAADGRHNTLGPTNGPYGKHWVNVLEYGEVLLLDSGGQRILRAFPLAGLPPQRLVVTPNAVYCQRQGDGALPDSMLCRIERDTFDWKARIFPAAFDSGYGAGSAPYLPSNWVVDSAPGPVLFETIGARDGTLWIGGYDGVAQVDSVTLELINRVDACASGTVTIDSGPGVSPATGEHAILYDVINDSGTPCGLSGYPSIRLLAADGSSLRVEYTQGESQYMSSAGPRPFVLAPGDTAYFLVAKYRCDRGDLEAADSIVVRLPNRPHGVTASAGADGDASSIASCRGGPDDPGNRVAVSPLVATPSELYPS